MAISIGALGQTYSENFDSLAITGSSSALPANWLLAETGTNANLTYTAGTGSSNTGDTYGFGAAGSTERAFGGLQSGSVVPIIGTSFTNNTGATMTSLAIAYTGEQWRLGTAGRTDRLDFQISLDATSLTTGSWLDVDTLDFSSVVTAGTLGALNGNANSAAISGNVNLAGGLASGATFWIRWIDLNASGADDGLAIDDFSLSANGVVAQQPGVLSIADASIAEGNAGTTSLVFTVTRSGGSDGPVSADWTITPGSASASDLAAGQPLTGTVAFAAGATSAQIVVGVAGDTAFETDETFTIALGNAQGGATLGQATATGTILNDDAAPPAPPANVFINEIHYDNTGTDAGEAIEIAGRAGTDLTGYKLVLYNGGSSATEAANAIVYNTRTLSGVIDDEGLGYGAISFSYPSNGIQNGSPDGIALVAPDGTVVQFLSYEGVLVGGAGTPAAGLTSTDIGVSENGSGALGNSLQLIGNGAVGADFNWQGEAAASFGTLNTGQSFIADDATGQVSVRDASVAEGDSGSRDLVFTVQRAGGLGSAASVDYTVVLDGSANAADLAAGAVLAGSVTFAVGQSSAQVRVAIAGDTVGEGNETLSVNLANPQGNIAILDGTARGTIVNDDPIALTIAEIQGAGHVSAYVGQLVTTSGIVTAVAANGYYVQSAVGDGNAATSEGIFVFTGSGGAGGVAVGDALMLRGTVAEFQASAVALSVTQLSNATFTVTSSGNALPQAVLIGAGGILPPASVIDDDGFAVFDPANDGIDFWESLEGMRVTLDTPQAVSNTTGFGETDVVVSGGAGASGVNDRGGITISEGDYNPEKIQIDDLGTGPFFTPTSLTPGDRLANVTGVVNYAFSTYEVLVTQPTAVTSDVSLAQEVTALRGDDTHLSLATFNLENLDPGDGKFALLASQIVLNLQAPDILAVQEIQDADGAGSGSDLSGQATADSLIAAIQAAGGPTYVYVEVAPTTAGTTGGEPGGNIRNGYFYNPERVSYIAGSASLIDGPAYAGSRRPLTADFVFNGETFTAIVVHFTSRGGSEPLFGDNQPPANAGDSARTAQAAAVKAYVNDQLATDPDHQFAILGDFNGFYFENAQRLLTDPAQGGVFANLAETLLSPEERYSYVFEGNSQLLDNILVTGGLLDGAAYDAVHVNSQFVSSASRPTDHDPQLALLYFNAAPTALRLSNATVAENAGAGAVVGTLAASDSAGDVLTYALLDDAGGLFVVDPSTGVVTATRSFDFESETGFTIRARATDQGGKSIVMDFAIAVTNVNEAPVAGDDVAAVDEDGTTGNLYATLLGNDSDPDAGARLAITAVDTSATLGRVVFDAAGASLQYVADADAFDFLAPGETYVDSFSYTVTDEFGLSDTATVSVTVTGVADGIALNGGNGADILTGTAGEDVLRGDRGNDVLDGAAGHDLLFGGQGDDYQIGGSGIDGFVFGKSAGADTIADFELDRDFIVLADGQSLRSARVSDVNGDGVLDSVLGFTKGGSITLMGVSAPGEVEFKTFDPAKTGALDYVAPPEAGAMYHQHSDYLLM